MLLFCFFFFFSSRRRHTRLTCDWSSDVCSSDLFQLWSNLPSSLKMTPPRYQDISAHDIPEVTDDDGTRVRIVCGDFWGKKGPVEGVASEPRYLDVSVPPGQKKRLEVDRTRNAFA